MPEVYEFPTKTPLDVVTPAEGDARYAKLDASNQPFTGDISANNLSGTNTGDQNDHGLMDGLSDDDHPQYVLKTADRKVGVGKDLYAMYLVNPVYQIPMPDLGFGYTITNINVRCYSADPTTELDANIKYCDAWTTGAFPSTNQTLVTAINTTTGNYDSGVIAVDIASGKELYLLMDANVDYGVMWTITITYTLKTS